MSWTGETESKIIAWEVVSSTSSEVFNISAKQLLKRGFLPSGDLKMDRGVLFQAFAKWSEDE